MALASVRRPSRCGRDSPNDPVRGSTETITGAGARRHSWRIACAGAAAAAHEPTNDGSLLDAPRMPASGPTRAGAPR